MSASKVGVALLSVASAAVIAKIYGQSGLGVFALLRVAPAVFMVVTDPGYSHAIPFLSGNRKVRENTLVGNSIFVYVAVGALQISLWVVLVPLIHQHLLSPVPIIAVYFAALLAPMQSIMIVIVNLLRARFHYNLANSVFLMVELALVLLTVLSALWFEPDFANLVYLLILSSGFALMVGVGFVVRSGTARKLQLDKSVLIEGLRFGIKSQIGNGFQILNYRLDHLLLGFFLIPEKVAIYFVATKSIEFFRFFTASIVFVFEPVFAEQMKVDAKQRVRKMLLPLSLANLFLLLVGVALAPLLYPLIFGGWSSGANEPLMILAIGLAVSGANSLFGAYFLARGLPGVTTLASLAGLIITVVFSLILIPRLEIIGAAITSSMAYAVITFVYIWVFFFSKSSVEMRELK